MFSLLSRSKSKLNKSEVQLPAQEDASSANANAVNQDSEQPVAASDPELAVPIVIIEAPLQLPQEDDGRPSASIYSSDDRQDATEDAPGGSTVDVSSVPPSQNSAEPEAKSPERPPNARRFSFRPLSFKFMNGQTIEEHNAKPAVLSAEQVHKKKLQAAEDRTKRIVRISSADKKAKESAIIVRSLIIGPTSITLSQAKVKAISKPKVEKVKTQLLKPKSASRVIAQLRALPAATHEDSETGLHPAAPIHAVCLRLTDAEAEKQHFSVIAGAKSVYNASIADLTTVFGEMELVNLVTAPNLGLGEPGNQPGLLSGAVPTAETVIRGVEQITPQLMGLGYATGKMLPPDHTNIHPPTDRISVLTYWWGFEVCLPPPSIQYLSGAPSVAHSLINVLSALAILNQGVREILPFVRYISSFIDTEFNMIQREDNGKGVVCAATWLIPAALVPRPWDFAPAPALVIQPAPTEDPSKNEPSSDEPSASPDEPADEPPAPTRPVSPPTLLPPLSIHEPAFGESEHDTSAPVDSAPAPAPTTAALETSAAEGAAEETEASEEIAGELPVVSVVPATPSASGFTTTSVETAIAF